MSNRIDGWRADLENAKFLASLPSAAPITRAMRSKKKSSLDPRKLLKVENQGQVGSCQGHALSSIAEWCAMIASGDTSIALSRAQAYYMTQKIDGLLGRDVGSTISGGYELATKFGVCEENLWEYTSRYDPQFPSNFAAVEQSAERFRIKSGLRIHTYEDLSTFLGLALGGASFGIAWGPEMDRKVVERFTGSGGGGHAIAVVALSDQLDSQGRAYPWVLNSWGDQWGDNGWQKWSPTAVDQILRHRMTVAIGLSDMVNLQPREFSSAEDWKDLKVI